MDFDIFYVNARSLKGHFDDIKADIYAMRSKYLCFVETWFQNTEKAKEYLLKTDQVTQKKLCKTHSMSHLSYTKAVSYRQSSNKKMIRICPSEKEYFSNTDQATL